MQQQQRNDQSARFDAFHAVRDIVEEMRGTKLHDDEADSITEAAEDLLLARSDADQHAALAQVSFATLMDELERQRWAELAQGTGQQLRAAFAGCAPRAALAA